MGLFDLFKKDSKKTDKKKFINLQVKFDFQSVVNKKKSLLISIYALVVGNYFSKGLILSDHNFQPCPWEIDSSLNGQRNRPYEKKMSASKVSNNYGTCG